MSNYDGSGIGINYVGSPSILNNPLYVKYSPISVGSLDAAAIKTDLNLIICNYENLEIISYLQSLLRVIALVA